MATLKVLILFVATMFVAEGQEQGSVVLYDKGTVSNSNRGGIVRVYYNGRWGNLCDGYYYDFGYAEADVVCHQLGYTGASSYSTAFYKSYGTDTSPTILTNVDCFSSSYLVLLRCSYNSYSSGCSDNDDITVDCYSTRIWDSSPFSGMVRLQDGTYSNDGRVEVYCNDQWGTVCYDSGFTDETGDTVCKQLGYSGASSTSNAGSNTNLPIWLNTVDCSSGTSCLATCQSCPSTSVNCSDGNARVACEYSSSGNYNNFKTTCLFADDSNITIGGVVGIIIGAILVCLFFICLSIAIPIGICCCLGVGIGAAAGGASTSRYTRSI